MHPTGENVLTRYWIVTGYSCITLYARLSSTVHVTKLHLMQKFGCTHFLSPFVRCTSHRPRQFLSCHNWHQVSQIKQTEPFSTNGATGLKRNMCCPFSSRSTGSSLHKVKQKHILNPFLACFKKSTVNTIKH